MRESKLSLSQRLARLEELLAIPGTDPGELRDLGAPAELAQLVALLALRAVRRGPDPAGLQPAGILAAAGRAALAGVLPVAAVGEVRRLLGDAAEAVREAGAWDPAAPLWWEPLPAPSLLEAVHARLLGEVSPRDLFPPAGTALAMAFRAEGVRRWLGLPRLLSEDFLAALGEELAAAFASGRLALAREGVGAAGRLSVRRSDNVLYLSGLEEDLPAEVPHLSALVQTLLARLPLWLAAVGEEGLAAPQTAMLARYPAPSAGYAPHLDNPGGEADSGRALTFVLYLNPPERPCAGGEIALWDAGRDVTAEPAAVFPARGGTAVLFDSRTIPHQVRPLEEGPERWALTLWLQSGRGAALPPPAPRLAVDDVLFGVPAPPLPPGTVLFHEIDGPDPAGRMRIVRDLFAGSAGFQPASQERGRQDAGAPSKRAGIVATVAGAGEALTAWCEHHLALGFAHLLLVFDRLEDDGEAALAARLAARFGERLTVWSGKATERDRWDALPASAELAAARSRAAGGTTSYAVSARQVLHATAALVAAREGELGGEPLDWLLHLDADEFFVLEGAARGGETLADHFAAAEAAGYRQIRYVNHELLLPWRPGERPRFKLNPRLAEARLGSGGWAGLAAFLRMTQTDRRPYYQGYFNGKSAVFVPAGREAAGVHGWTLEEGAQGAAFVAGPAVLHLLCPTREAFCRKFLAKAASPAPEGPLPFPPSPVEEAVMAEIRALQAAGASPQDLAHRLGELYAELVCFQPDEIELLEEAGLFLSIDRDQVLAFLR